MTAEDLERMIQTELANFTVVPAELLEPFLIRPYSQVRRWEYSRLNESFPLWIIADFGKGEIGLAFSEFGHGDDWGVIKKTENRFGGDDSWFLCLEDAFINSGFYKGDLPSDYEVR